MQQERNLPPDIFQISTGTSDPIYRQFVEQLRRLIAGGRVHPNDMLPSVREVASELGVNPMTVSKAYSMLETEGLLARRRGMGMVIAERSTKSSGTDHRLELLRPGLERVAEEAKQLELEPKAVIALFNEIVKGKSA